MTTSAFVQAQTTGGSFGGSSWGAGGSTAGSSSSSSSSSSGGSSSSSVSSGSSNSVVTTPTVDTSSSDNSSSLPLHNVHSWAQVRIVQDSPFDPNSQREECISTLIVKLLAEHFQYYRNDSGTRTMVRPRVTINSLRPDACGVGHCEDEFGYNFLWSTPYHHGYGWILPAFNPPSVIPVWEFSSNREVQYYSFQCGLNPDAPGLGDGLVFRIVETGSRNSMMPIQAFSIIDSRVK